MLLSSVRAVAQQSQSEDPVLVPERLTWHMPNPQQARESFRASLEQAKQSNAADDVAYYTRILERLDSTRREREVPISLEDVIHRTLANNYTIETLSFNPAIETTRVVEAEAAFDAAFFFNVQKRNVDQPSASALFSTDADFTTISSGVTKLLPTGTTITGQYDLTRAKQSFAFQNSALNPSFSSDIRLDIRQPLLRGAGLDFNRSAIVLTQNNRQIGELAFRRQVRDTLRQVEELYWRFVQARIDMVITAREVADFERIYRYLVARKDFDILPVSIAASEADLHAARVDFVRRRAILFDAQDRLVGVINDPEINLIDNLELVPTDFPKFERIVVDRVAEVQSGLDHRTELKEQEIRVASAKVNIRRAINAELPQMDLTFAVITGGLAGNADRAFDEVSRRKFITYEVGVQFQLPIGNRSAHAARRRAELEHGQAAANLRREIEGIILDVNLSVRAMETSFDQISPGFSSVEARQRELDSHVARAERKDVGTLNTELGARRSLASSRRVLLNAVVEYNIAIADLERSKGTLLQYNNVIIPTEDD